MIKDYSLRSMAYAIPLPEVIKTAVSLICYTIMTKIKVIALNFFYTDDSDTDNSSFTDSESDDGNLYLYKAHAELIELLQGRVTASILTF